MVHFVSDTLLLAVDLGMDAVAAYTLDPAAGRLSAGRGADRRTCRRDSARGTWWRCPTIWWPSSVN